MGVFSPEHGQASVHRFGLRQLREKFEDLTFDLLHGTDTRRHAPLATLNIESDNKKHGQRYQPSPVYSFRRILRSLKSDFETFAFVDFGSGKGRTLLVAAEFPFKRIVGIEFSEELNACAMQNIAATGASKDRDIEIVQSDASCYALPTEDLVLYFFNPFTEPVLRRTGECRGIGHTATAAHHRHLLIPRCTGSAGRLWIQARVDLASVSRL
jgi:hypothetical protein